MVKESKCCRDVIKRDFNEILVIAQKDLLDFHNSTKCLIWDNLYVDGNGKVSILFKYLSEEFDINILDKGKQKVFYPYDYMTAFEKI